MTVDLNRELCNREHDTLRTELNNLKNCQVTFLTFSVTTAGVLLGFIKTFSPSNYEIFFLTPLIILLPAWSIFFDKAKTISRIVGYYRIIEMLILDKISTDNFVGWENALQEFRDSEHEEMKIKRVVIDELRKNLRKERKTLGLSLRVICSPFRNYWTLVTCVFLCLSTLCWILGIIPVLANINLSLGLNHLGETVVIAVASIVFVYTSIHNLSILYHLLYGKHSYEANEHFWNHILGVHIQISVRDSSDFVDRSFKTSVIPEEKGIKEVTGKLKSDPNGGMHVQKYLFDKSKCWTMKRAKNWVEAKNAEANSTKK